MIGLDPWNHDMGVAGLPCRQLPELERHRQDLPELLLARRWRCVTP